MKVHHGKPFVTTPSERKLINLLNEMSINHKLDFETLNDITFLVRQMKYELSDWIVEAYIKSEQQRIFGICYELPRCYS